MPSRSLTTILLACFVVTVVLCAAPLRVLSQFSASIEGLIVDQTGAVVTGVEVKAICRPIGVERVEVTDTLGIYQIAALPVGDYRLEARAKGFQTQVVEPVRVEVGQRVLQDFQLRIGDILHEVTPFRPLLGGSEDCLVAESDGSAKLALGFGFPFSSRCARVADAKLKARIKSSASERHRA